MSDALARIAEALERLAPAPMPATSSPTEPCSPTTSSLHQSIRP